VKERLRAALAHFDDRGATQDEAKPPLSLPVVEQVQNERLPGDHEPSVVIDESMSIPHDV
jgi:hypothetical protein